MPANPHRMKLNREISLLRRIIALLEKYGEFTHGLDTNFHLDIYREWLQEAIAEREALPNLVNILRDEK
jgi:hypothetical protein